jgi:hypothetical protein
VDLAVDLLEEVEAEQQQRRRGLLCPRRVHEVPDREQAWVVGWSTPVT